MGTALLMYALAVLAAPVMSQSTSCTGGRVYTSCGVPCPMTCENYQNPPICLTACASGCFCPQGTVLHNDQCIDTSECPGAVTSPPPPTVAVTAATTPPVEEPCINGKLFEMCGSACPPTCDNYQSPVPCPLICVQGCFCPHGLVELGDMCVSPTSCPDAVTAPPTTPPPTPTCTSGKVFQSCGTACPRTCDNYQQAFLPCTRQCVIGCFCPEGMVEMGDACVPPSECPAENTTTTIAVTAATSPPVEEPCINGKLFEMCGTACPLTCDNYRSPPFACPAICVQGCFCPHGLVELGDMCVPSTSCPDAVTSPPTIPPPTTAVAATTPPVEEPCINGKLFEMCGSACPPTCDNYQSPVPCPLICVQGCFCPHGLVELGDMCVPPTSCPDAVTAPPTTHPPTPTCTSGKVFQSCGTACPRTCDNYQQAFLPCTRQCVIGCFCPEGMVEMGDTCVPPSECPAVTTTMSPPVEEPCINGKLFEMCGTACPLTCDNYRNPPTGCIDECVQGCFCPHGLVELGAMCVPSTSCPEQECPDGMEYRECGPLCPYTCDSYFGTNPCFSLRCAPGGCFCPENQVMADGQCTPAEVACRDIKPTTDVNVHEPSPVRLEIKIRNTALEEFMNHEGTFLTAVKNLLSSRGYGDVQANVHSISQDEHLVVVIQLSSDGISAAQAQELANLLSDQSSTLTLEIVEVTVSDDDDGDDSGAALSSPAIIGIAVGASVVGLILILLLSAILVVCIVNRSRQTHSREKYGGVTELSTVNAAHDDYSKDKLVRESLSY